MAEGFEIAKAFVKVSPDSEGFKEELQAALDSAVAGVDGKVRVGLDTADVDAKADEVKAKIDELNAVRADPEVGLVAGDLDAKVDEIKAKLDELDGKRAEPKAGLSTADFDAKLDEAEARLDAFNAKTAEPRLGATGGGGGGGRGESGGSLAGAITMGVGALMPGIGGAVTGLGMLGATGAAAFGGVARALSAAHQASLNVGLTSQQMAATEFQNAVQVQQAQHTVAMAHQQAAQDAVTSSESIEQAQLSLASVERNAAEQQVQALQSVKQAQQGVEEADYNLREAQYQLTQAWVQAREQIRQLDDQLADSKLNVQQAELAIQQAEYQQRLINQNAYSTSIDRQQAALAVAQAHQQLTDAQDQETAAQYAATLANKQGVAHSQTVIQAKQGVTAATYQQQDAHFAYADAQRQATLAQLNSAAQIKQAQLSLAAAEQQASFQRIRDAEQVAFAEKTVANTVEAQKLQWASMLSTENAAANQFAKDMGRLSPAAQHLVEQILGMRGALKKIQTDAQNAVAPGVTVFFQGLQTMLPTIEGGITRTGKAIGGMFADLGKAMSTPAAAHVLDGLITNGLQFAKIVGPAFGDFAAKLGEIGAKKGAADGLANLLAGFAHGLTGMADAIGKNEKPINSFLSAAGVIIAQIGPPLGQLVGLVAKVFEPLTRYLNQHPNGTVAKTLGGILAGVLAFKGLEKVASGPIKAIGKAVDGLKGLPQKSKDWAAKVKSAWSTLTGVPGKVKGAFDKVFGDGGMWPDIRRRALYTVDNIRGFFTSTLPGAVKRGGQAIYDFTADGITKIAGWGSKVGSTMKSAGTAVAEFAAGLGRQMLSALKATGVWIAEHTVATATFIAENVAQAASATAAFVAENAATLGIVAGIGVLVAAIVWMATHWKETWHAIEVAALWLWHNVLDPFWQGIEAGAKWLYQNAILPLARGIQAQFSVIEGAASWLWHNVFDPLWQGIKSGASGFVSAFKTTWEKLKGIFSDPVSFLVNTVYDGGIAKLWNDVVGAVGATSLNLPVIKFADGGVVPGYAPGHDTVPAMLSPGEGVLVPEAVQALGPGTVHSLNSTYGRGRTSSGNHFAGGGIVSDITSAVGGFFSGAVDVAKIVSSLATGNTTALTNALGKFVSTKALGGYGKLMLSLPQKLISEAVKAITSMFSSSGGASPGPVSGTVAEWFQKAVQLTGVGSGWLPGLETIGHYESSDNPYAINNTDINAQNGDPSRGIMQTIMSTFNAYHQPGTSNNIFDPVANIAAAINYIKARYGTVANVPGIRSLAHGGPYVGYDSGGWLMPSDLPGAGVPVNKLGKPEAVLTPEESDAFVKIVRMLAAQGVGQGGGTPLGHKHATINFYGTQVPGPEQMAAIQREMGLALSGA